MTKEMEQFLGIFNVSLVLRRYGDFWEASLVNFSNDSTVVRLTGKDLDGLMLETKRIYMQTRDILIMT